MERGSTATSEVKKYCVAEFDGNDEVEVTVVPRQWVGNNDNAPVCSWPAEQDPIKLHNLIVRGQKPDTTWSVLPIKVLYQSG